MAERKRLTQQKREMEARRPHFETFHISKKKVHGRRSQKKHGEDKRAKDEARKKLQALSQDGDRVECRRDSAEKSWNQKERVGKSMRSRSRRIRGRNREKRGRRRTRGNGGEGEEEGEEEGKKRRKRRGRQKRRKRIIIRRGKK